VTTERLPGRACVLLAVVLFSLAAVPAYAGKPSTPEKCGAAKRNAAGKKLACKLNCTAKAVGKGLPATDPTLGACLATCGGKFDTAFANAEKHGGCLPAGDGDKVEAYLDRFLASLEETTYTQSSWGEGPGSIVLNVNFDAVYAATFGLLSGGLSGGFTMVFTDAESVVQYLPAIGAPGPLNGSVLNPISTAAGGFGGEVVGLTLNVDFSDARVNGGLAVPFGDLALCDVGTLPVNGMKVRELLAVANTLLGGGSSPPFTIAEVDPVLRDLNAAFSDGVPGPFASHLVTGACACPAPKVDCNGVCVDPTTDAANCGSCGNVCGQNEICAGSSCACAAPAMLCGTQCNVRFCPCVAVQSDPANCGTCGHVCTSGVCAAGTCQ